MRIAVLALFVAFFIALPASAQTQLTYGEQEVQTVVGANNALNQFFQIEIESMPPAMLQKAEGIAIFPKIGRAHV